MFKSRKFKIASEEIVPLLSRSMGAGFASDHIMVDGRPVGFMYREEPDNDVDSGWRFLSGEESQDYIDSADNLAIYDLNTIANYDPTIIPFLDSPIGTELERVLGSSQFRIAR
jgi:hypothetical protein